MFCNGKKNVLTFSDISQFEVVTVAEGIACHGLALMFGYVSLMLWQRARQEPEGNAGDEQEAGRNQEAHPPGAHPPGIFGSDGHTFWMMGKRCFQNCTVNKSFILTFLSLKIRAAPQRDSEQFYLTCPDRCVASLYGCMSELCSISIELSRNWSEPRTHRHFYSDHFSWWLHHRHSQQ